MSLSILSCRVSRRSQFSSSRSALVSPSLPGSGLPPSIAACAIQLAMVLRETPNSRQTSLIDSPSSNLATNRRRSSINEHSFHGIDTSRSIAESVTHVSGTTCYLCLGPLKRLAPQNQVLLTTVGPLWDPLSTAS